MAKSPLCLVYWHKWTLTENPDGESYKRCSRCGVEAVVDMSDPAASDGFLYRKGAQGLSDWRLRKRR
jgi:hypothetical protein